MNIKEQNLHSGIIPMKKILPAAFFTIFGATLLAGDPTPPYRDSDIQAQLRLNVKEDADVLHFIRDSNDPKVFTKIYELKHADPYEIRSFVREVVQSKRVNDSYTGVECIKYNDGKGFLIVSAEEYRFADQKDAMGIDSIVAMFDQPGVVNSSGQPKLMYFPTNVSAKTLQKMVKEVGANVSNDTSELIGGKDKIEYDASLNALFMNVADYSRKHIEDVLNKYDVAYPEARIRFKVYEIYSENDDKLGLDFQAWKNNDGADLFSVAGRYRDNWASAYGSGPLKGSGSNRTQVFNVNPKWNSRYIDFLASHSKAKIAYSGEITVRANESAAFERKTQIFLAETGNNLDPSVPMQNIELFNVSITTDGTATSGYLLTASDFHGDKLTLADANGNPATTLKTSFSAIKTGTTGKNNARYDLALENGVFLAGGGNKGSEATVSYFKLEKLGTDTAGKQTKTEVAWNNDIVIERGYEINVKPSSSFGFGFTVKAAITDSTTLLNLTVNNSSLIGYNSNGTARIQQGNSINTTVTISNDSKRFVIGGIHKKELVRGVGGLPFLKDLPIIGYVFSTETESLKDAQLLIVAECEVVTPESRPDKADLDKTSEIEKDLDRTHNKYGFRQYLIDDQR